MGALDNLLFACRTHLWTASEDSAIEIETLKTVIDRDIISVLVTKINDFLIGKCSVEKFFAIFENTRIQPAARKRKTLCQLTGATTDCLQVMVADDGIYSIDKPWDVLNLEYAHGVNQLYSQKMHIIDCDIAKIGLEYNHLIRLLRNPEVQVISELLSQDAKTKGCVNRHKSAKNES